MLGGHGVLGERLWVGRRVVLRLVCPDDKYVSKTEEADIFARRAALSTHDTPVDAARATLLHVPDTEDPSAQLFNEGHLHEHHRPLAQQGRQIAAVES